jgi:hypothetical protein
VEPVADWSGRKWHRRNTSVRWIEAEEALSVGKVKTSYDAHKRKEKSS